jgi:hypothetical protein
MRHLPFAIAGDWHGLALRVFAPQRFARRISKSMGLFLRFRSHPTPLHIADDGLTAVVDVDVFDRDFLLSFAAMTVQRLQQGSVGARELVCLAKVFAATFKCLLA